MERFLRAISFALLLIPLAARPVTAQRADDPLSPELRRQVEQLKADAALRPTDAENVRERATILWQWTNALSEQGEVFSVDLPMWLSYGTGRPLEDPTPALAFRPIDASIREHQVKEEIPGAVGPVTTSSPGPFVVGSYQTIRQTYTVGELDMVEGGGISLGHQLMVDYGILQATDPAMPNYVTISSSNPEARFEPVAQRLASFIHGSYPPLSFRLTGTSLTKGESMTVTFGDRRGGSPGLLVQTFENDSMLLPLYVDLEGKGHYFSARWPPHQVIGGAATAVRAFAPSVVGVGEVFTLAVRAEDRWYNRATLSVPRFEVLLDGRRVALSSGEALTEIEASLPESGVFRYEVRSIEADAEGKIESRSNPVWVQVDPERRILWGETHGHTGMAEGQGSLASYFRYGRDDARLDFLALSEHDVWMDDLEWRQLIEAVERYNVDDEFVVFLSFEWTAGVEFGGHHNVFYRTAPGRRRVPLQEAGVLWELYKGLHRDNRAQDLLVIPHAHIPGDWRLSDPQVERLVEICSMHGTFEWFGNYYLKNGHQIGFVGASDNHESRPGYSGNSATGAFQHFGGLAAVFAEAKQSDAVFDAMRNIAAYATSDAARIVLDTTLNGSPMGRRLSYSDERRLEVRVLGTSPIDTIDVIKNGEVLYRKRYLDAELRPSTWLAIGFESGSELGFRDTPRGNRVWKGSLQVSGGRIGEIRPVGVQNRHFEEVAANDAGGVDFHVETRGDRDTLLVQVLEATPKTRVRFELEATREHGQTYPVFDRPRTFPATDLEISLADLTDGPLEHELRSTSRGAPPEGYVDRLTLDLVAPEGALDRELAFTDLDAPRPGDYYYIRVTQLDGSRAWSSPWWIGDLPPR